MKKRRPHLFIGIAVFALAGIITTQALWVNDALILREELFRQRVKVALKSVSTQILDSQIDSTAKYILSPCDTIQFVNKAVSEIIDARQLDSLLVFELKCMEIADTYTYGVFNERDSSFVMGTYHGHEKALLDSKHRVSLSCIYKRDVYYLSLLFPFQERTMLHEMILMIILTLLFLPILTISFYLVIKLMFRQKTLTQIKADFVNNMTHEFKTPIATIPLSSEMLLKSEVNSFPYKTRRYAQVIFDENARLQQQVDQVLQLSVLEKGEYTLKLKETDLHRIIRKMAEHFSVTVRNKGGMISTDLGASVHHLEADRTHLANILSNLIDNAIKYSPENPDIKISTSNGRNSIIISVSDNGIGISPENQKHIFKKLYRVPTGDIHDVKGFGLGLFYVKTMVEAHHGKVRIISEMNKGTTFVVELPTHQ